MDGVDAAAALPEAEPFPLTDLQQAYLVGSTSMVELGNLWPNYYVELDVAGLDVSRAEQAINLLIAQHEQLRTEILADGMARVLPPSQVAPFTVKVADLAGLDTESQEAAIRQTRQRMSERGVAPTGWPLFEVVISRIRPHRVRAHLSMSLLLLDGRGIRQVWSEWRTLYHDPGALLATAPTTFRECLLRRVATAAAGHRGEHWQYWRQRLAALPDGPALPLARLPGSIDPVRFTRRTCHLTAAQWQRFSASARQHKLMPATAMLHLFAETIGRWAASPRFCLNVLHQGWSAGLPEAASVVGQFGDTLPLEIRGEGGFWQRAQQTQSQFWRDFEHSQVGGVTIIREAAAERGLPPRASLPYVFTSMLHPRSGPAQALPPRPACAMVHSSLRTPQVLIDNQVMDADDGGVDCVWDVVDDAYPAGLPGLMFAGYEGMVAAIAGQDAALACGPDPVAAGHRALVAQINDTAAPVPPGRLEDGFLRQAAARPGAVAVCTPQLALTYGDLAEASLTVAGWLRAHGTGREDVVPVVMTKGWEQVAAVLGVLRAGAAYCPIDASLPASRIRSLIADLAATVVLTQSHSACPDGTMVPAASLPTLAVDQWRTVACGTAPVAAPSSPGDATDLAYVIHTSGSTGQPKGVMIEHRSALNTVMDVNERIGLCPADRVFGLSSLSFDLSVWDVFGTLAAGATLVLPSATSRPDPVGWVAAAAEHGVTVWNSVPALAEMLVEVAAERPGLGRPPIRAVLLSGDWIGLSLPGRVRDVWPAAEIVAMGGATEASIWSNSYQVGQVNPAWQSIPYGTPLRNQTMRVLDHGLAVCPPWAQGGIYIGGTGLARGYWRDPARTAGRFITHPGTGERLYLTGDLGRYWPDGTIEFLGRADRQAKIQGFRVEPGEVEAAIRSHPGVSNCLVCVQQLAGAQRRLVSLVVPSERASLPAEVVAEHLRALLPHYMVPALIHIVPSLPLTPNGKIDVARAIALLPAGPAAAAGCLPGGQPGAPAAAVAGYPSGGPAAAVAGCPPGGQPGGPLAGRLSRIWAELPGTAPAGPDDDLFALGGTSLTILRLVHRVRAELGADLEFGQVFEARTIRSLTRRIAGGAGPGGGCVVKLADGEGTGLTLFHPVGGSVAGYLELARAWAGPVHAVQSRGLVGHEPGAGRDLSAMAASYLAELPRPSPGTLRVLAGWSMGGVLAYEAGRQLSGMAEDCRVIMIDSEVPGAATARLGSGHPAGQRRHRGGVGRDQQPAARHIGFLRDLAGGRLPASAPLPLLQADGDEVAQRAREVAIAHGLLPAATDLGGYTRLAAVHARNTEVLAGYRPASSPVPTLLFVASAQPGRPDPVPGWQAVCPGIEVEPLPGDHYSVLTGPGLDAIVSRAQDWLRAVSVS